MSKRVIQDELFPVKSTNRLMFTQKEKLVKGWVLTEFSNIALLSTTKVDSEKESKNYECIELEHLESGSGRLLGTVTLRSGASLKNKFSPGDILYGKLRPYLRKFYRPSFEGVCSSEIWVLKANKICDSSYLFYLVQSERFSAVANISSGSKMPRADWTFVSEIPFSLPPLPEQHKIAAILSTWDNAIDTTEKLIAAKEQLKKGLMQQLLTGKTKFREEESKLWREVKLGDIFTERKEIGYSHLELLAITGLSGVVKRDTLEKKDSSAEDKGKYLRIVPGDIGYNTMRMWQGVSGVSTYEGIISPAYTVVTPTTDIDVQYMGYLFKFPPMVYLFWRYSQGLVDDTLNCKYDSFSKIHTRIPCKSEQQKIASVLSTCDLEIQTLRAQLTALKEQKKGLMQQLLTGRVRVKVEEQGE